jgi:2-polyprenyl-3-methyl-5-hydroxy-6-metoxy-1,4-benzoquinol methylase
MVNQNENRYPIKTSKFSSHSKISAYLNRKSLDRNALKILDIGCAKGELKNLLLSESIQYLGVEPFMSDYLAAKANGLDVIHCSAEDAIALLDSKFDNIVFADVLEHLQNPIELLNDYRKFLSPGGEIVISIPNVAHWSNRLGLLFGKWNYTDRGILDRTHLRFFTKKSFQKELTRCEYEIVRFMSTPVPLEALFPKLNRTLFVLLDSMLYLPTKLYPRVFGFQLLYIIKTIN